MSRKKVLLADYAWNDLTIEESILSAADLELIVAPDQEEATLLRLAADVDGIMTCWAQIHRPVLEAAPKCRIVSRFGIGLDNIDVAYCSERGILVTNVPDYCTREVAEHTIALLFALARRVGIFHHATKSNRYELSDGLPMRQLRGSTLGVLGWGKIGQEVARIAAALDLHVCTLRRKSTRAPANVELCDLQTLIEQSDFISLHLPLTHETRAIIDAQAFSTMKSTAFLINTSRGPLIDHQALAVALKENSIAGAALDVQDPEPPDLTVPPYNDDRVIVTPHAAFVSTESVEQLRRRTATQIADYLSGRMPENRVN